MSSTQHTIIVNTKSDHNTTSFSAKNPGPLRPKLQPYIDSGWLPKNQVYKLTRYERWTLENIPELQDLILSSPDKEPKLSFEQFKTAQIKFPTNIQEFLHISFLADQIKSGHKKLFNVLVLSNYFLLITKQHYLTHYNPKDFQQNNLYQPDTSTALIEQQQSVVFVVQERLNFYDYLEKFTDSDSSLFKLFSLGLITIEAIIWLYSNNPERIRILDTSAIFDDIMNGRIDIRIIACLPKALSQPESDSDSPPDIETKTNCTSSTTSTDSPSSPCTTWDQLLRKQMRVISDDDSTDSSDCDAPKIHNATLRSYTAVQLHPRVLDDDNTESGSYNADDPEAALADIATPSKPSQQPSF